MHAFVTDLERPVGTYLYGRRMYNTMVYWETADVSDEPPFVSGSCLRDGASTRVPAAVARDAITDQSGTVRVYDSAGLASRLVGEDEDAIRTDRRGAHQPQPRARRPIAEQALTGAENDGEDHESVLVHEVMLS